MVSLLGMVMRCLFLLVVVLSWRLLPSCDIKRYFGCHHHLQITETRQIRERYQKNENLAIDGQTTATIISRARVHDVVSPS